MEIYYRDEPPVEAVCISEMNTVRGEGVDRLYRDVDGAYYLKRHREEHQGGYSELHRINIVAAILWCVEFMDDTGLLRQDVASMLMEVGISRDTYLDPCWTDYPAIRAEREGHTSEEWVARVLAGTAEPPAPVSPHPAHQPAVCTMTLCDAADGSEWVKVPLDNEEYAGVSEYAADQGISFEEAFLALIRWGMEMKWAATPPETQSTLPADPAAPPAGKREWAYLFPKSNPADVALLAAAEPEPVEEDAPRPIRDVLADLAADWRAKAKEARTQAQDLQPFNAGHKLHGQADLLELCADTLAEAISSARYGEEGE